MARRRVHTQLEVMHSSPSVAGTTLVTQRQAPKCGPPVEPVSTYIFLNLWWDIPPLVFLSSPETLYPTPNVCPTERLGEAVRTRDQVTSTIRRCQQVSANSETWTAPAGAMLRIETTVQESQQVRSEADSGGACGHKRNPDGAEADRYGRSG